MERFIRDVRKDLTVEHQSKDSDLKKIILDKALACSRFIDYSFEKIEYIVERTLVSVSSDISILAKYVEDDSIDEIMVNGYNKIYLDRGGKIEKAEETFFNSFELEEVIRRIAGNLNREINENNPILDARLADGSRVCAVYKNIAINGPTLNIRKFKDKNMS